MWCVLIFQGGEHGYCNYCREPYDPAPCHDAQKIAFRLIVTPIERKDFDDGLKKAHGVEGVVKRNRLPVL